MASYGRSTRHVRYSAAAVSWSAGRVGNVVALALAHRAAGVPGSSTHAEVSMIRGRVARKSSKSPSHPVPRSRVDVEQLSGEGAQGDVTLVDRLTHRPR
jgi:hypothetical protein